MKRSLISSTIFIALLFISHATINEETLFTEDKNAGWQTVIGGTGYEWASDFIVTSDNGYLFVGQALVSDDGHNRNQDLLLIKTDSCGNQVWSNTYGGSDSEVGYSVKETQGGYIATGHHRQGTLATVVYEVETDFDGNLIWEKTLGEVSPYLGPKHVNTTDGGSISIIYDNDGEAQYLKKTKLPDGLGGVQWKISPRHWGQWANSVMETSGGYVVMGVISVARASDIYLAKVNSTGDLQWCRYYGGPADEQCSSFSEAPDGGFIIAGYTTSFGAGSSDIYVLKTDSDGILLWQKTYGGPEWDGCAAMYVTEDGGITLAGNTSSFGAGEGDIFLVRVSDYELPQADFESPYSAVEGADASFDGSKSRSNYTLTRYEWDFGDRSPRVLGSSSKHIYSEPGDYIVRLNVTDEYGNWGVNSSPINVKPSFERLSASINATLSIDYEAFRASDSLVVTLWNHRDEICYGADWRIDRYVMGEWKPWYAPSSVIAIAYYLQTNGRDTFKIPYSTENLPNGLYRVSKSYSHPDDYHVTKNAYAEFEVTDSLVIDPLFLTLLIGLLVLSFLIILAIGMHKRAFGAIALSPKPKPNK